MKKRWFIGGLLWGATLCAQAPVIMDGAEALRMKEITWGSPFRDESLPELPWGGEVGALSTLGPGGRWVPLSEGGGMGTAIRGGGLLVSLARQTRGWDLALTELFLDRPGEGTHATLYTGHLAYQTEGGWRFSLEQEPMRWGYGPMGGHLLGTSSAPFPKLRVMSRTFGPELFGRTLGRWRFDWFTGQLESTRTIPQWHQSYATELAAANSREGYAQDYGRPYQSGLLITGEFFDKVELNLGLTSMWGGVERDGHNRMAGLSWKDYVTGSFGAENLVAEGGTQADLSHFHALSNGIASVELRVKSSMLADWFHAQRAYWYYSYAGENVRCKWKEMSQRSLPIITGAVYAGGLQLDWGDWKLGLEFRDSDTFEPDPGNYQTYQNDTFLSGHSRLGDSLGFTEGGGLRMGTVALDGNLGRGFTGRLLLAAGVRRSVEDLSAWQALHPGELPQSTDLYCMELNLQHVLQTGWRWGFGLGVKRECHVQFTDRAETSANLVASVARRFSLGR